MSSKLVKFHDLHGRELLIKADAVNFVQFPAARSEKAKSLIGIGNGFAVLETVEQVKTILKKAGVTFIED